MALKKSELYSSLWKSCDELRGGMDASQYKDYVLVLLFVKYVTDKYSGDPAALIDVPLPEGGKPGGSFADMVAAKGDKEIGDKINKIIATLADANEVLKGAINVADFNDEEKLGKGREMVDRLTKLVAIFEGLDFGRNRAEGDDLLGDAYEYLMRHFATESGKSKGQFYTPAEVSRIMSMLIDLGRVTHAGQSINDPTCGSGSLLLKAHDEARSRTGLDLALCGQKMDNATSALARMNMVLHDCPTAEIWQANVLASPHFEGADGRLKTFDSVVANFPFSNKNWTSGLDPANDLYGRFEYGIPPAKNGDYAFLLHILTSLKSTADIRWLAVVLESMKLNQYSESSAQPGLSVAKLLALSCRVPDVQEQTAIATILSDIDAELAALAARRDKTRALKQGMMQALLTGRIRLMKAPPAPPAS